MRHLMLIALVAAVAAATQLHEFSRESIRESIFRPGVEYIYRYESQVLTGIRTVSDQLTGVKVRALVKVQIHRDGSTLLQMENVGVYKVNEGVTRERRFETVPEHKLTELTGEPEQEMVEKLIKPIKFRFTEGEVRDVQSDVNDGYWSVNIKKGVLSLFQLKINDRSTVSTSSSSSSQDPESFLSSESIREEPLLQAGEPAGLMTDNILKVMEVDANGECETKYVIRSRESSSLSSVSDMLVSKVKDLDKCTKRNSFELGLFAGLPLYDTDKKLIQPSMEAEYVLSGDRHHFLIHKAQLEAKYLFTPYGQQAGQISSHIVRKLDLLRTTQIQTPISHGSFVTEKLGLKMEIPSADWTEEEQSSEIRARRQQAASEWDHKQVIEKRLAELLSSIYPTMLESSAIQVMQLNLVVRDVPHQHLLNIIKSYLQN